MNCIYNFFTLLGICLKFTEKTTVKLMHSSSSLEIYLTVTFTVNLREILKFAPLSIFTYKFPY